MRLACQIVVRSWCDPSFSQSFTIRYKHANIFNGCQSYKVLNCNYLCINFYPFLFQSHAYVFCRNIWSTHEGSREEILESGVIFRIASLLVLAKEKLEMDAKYSELVETCLKAMCAFLSTLDPRVAEQIRGEKDVQGYKCVVQCCEANNKLALKCLYNLCQIAECRPILGTFGATEILIALIKDHSQLSKETLISLCLFCREAVNRARIRIGSGLELMLSLLKDPENERYHPMLLHALAQFVCDDPSIVIMVKNGLLDILVARLKTMVTEAVANEENNVSKKRGNESPPNRQGEFKFNKTSLGRYGNEILLDLHSRLTLNQRLHCFITDLVQIITTMTGARAVLPVFPLHLPAHRRYLSTIP